MRKIHLIAVGKLKDENYQAIEKDFIKRISQFKLNVCEVKSHSGDREEEAKEVIKKIKEIGQNSKAHIILLTERGTLFNTIDFSKWFYFMLEARKEEIFLVLGGANGLGKSIIEISQETISLSPLTFPHRLARLLLVEQIYRCQTIYQQHPYHK